MRGFKQIKKAAILGTGNMGEAIICGILKSRLFPPHDILATDTREDRLDFIKDKYGIEVSTNNIASSRCSDLVVLAVKPQVIRDVLELIRSAITPKQLVLSIAAGVSTTKIAEILGNDARVIRAMPNTPALAGCGMSAICPGEACSKQDLDIASVFLKSVGEVIRVQEPLMDAVTALSGSGPAYMFLFLEAMVKAGIELGLNRQTAKTLAVNTMAGAASLAKDTRVELSDLRERVTSPGGTTMAALTVLEDRRFTELVKSAVRAASERSRQLREMF